MKDGDRFILKYDLTRMTRRYFPRDAIANRYFIGQVLDSRYCTDPKIMFPKVYHTAELKFSEN